MDDSRLSRDQLHMQVALLYSARATCDRLHVGAVLVKDKRIIATGYNGPPEGQPHCDHSNDPPNTPCTQAVHAEANIIAYCAKHGISTWDSTMYITHSPCIKCAELIIQAGIKRVVFGTAYRDITGLALLYSSGLAIDKAEFIENNFTTALYWERTIPYHVFKLLHDTQ